MTSNYRSATLSTILTTLVPPLVPRKLVQCLNGSHFAGRVAAFSTSISTRKKDSTTTDELPPYYDATAQYARITAVPRRIHILGTGSIGKFVAHSLRAISNPPPITLLFHRPTLLKAWHQAHQTIELETDGYKVPQSGFDVELAVGTQRQHGAPGPEPQSYQQSQPQQTQPLSETQSQQTPSQTTPFDSNNDEPIHNLIVTVKAPYTVAALAPIAHRLLPTSTVCLLQNGLGVVDELNKQLFPDPESRPNYVQGIVTHGVHTPNAVTHPFSAIHAGHGTIALGLLPRDDTAFKDNGDGSPKQDRGIQDSDPSPRYLLRTLTRTPVLAAVGLPPTELLQEQLEKLAVNAVINPLTSLLDAPNGSILYNFYLTRSMRLLLAEVSLVLRSLPELKGLPNVAARFSPDRLETLVVTVAANTERNLSSMLLDVRAGRTTEVRYINGYVVRRGEEMGVQCVTNYMMMQLVEGKQNMVARELQDRVPLQKVDQTGER